LTSNRVVDPTTCDVHKLQNRVTALELSVRQLLTMLHDDGTLLDEELHELEERLG
jgi:hypothetical protein